MKKSGLLAASMAAASATAISASSSCSSKIHFTHEDSVSRKSGGTSSSQDCAASEKFAPKFDGLRFIETLVTAHR